MNFVTVANVSAVVLGHPFVKSRLLIGLNCILFCLNNSSQIAKYPLINMLKRNATHSSLKFHIKVSKQGLFARPQLPGIIARNYEFSISEKL